MPGNHFFRDAGGDIGKVEMPCFLGNSGLKHHLQQQITQFIADILQIAALDGIGCLIGFLDCVGGNRLKSLFDIPRTSRFRVAQLDHDVNDPAQRGIGAGDAGGAMVCVRIGAGILHGDSVERKIEERNSDGASILSITCFLNLFSAHIFEVSI